MKNGPAYSHEEKIAIIREHEEGHKTLKQVCEKYGISKSYLCYLLKRYREERKKVCLHEAYILIGIKCVTCQGMRKNRCPCR